MCIHSYIASICYGLYFIFSYIASEWLINQHGDGFASSISHYDMVPYFALVANESKAQMKFNLMHVEC